MTVRTRFAPSPTGFLHIGSARTALFSWLFAKHHQGQFVLRIEDTDISRSTQAATDSILHAIEWLGLNYDEGPFYQMQRLSDYQEIAEKLLQNNQAYRCYCTEERLGKLREEQLNAKQKPRYDGHCRELKNHPKDQKYVIRFKNPDTGEVIVDDQVYGKIIFNNAELDDLVLLRSDGVPTYNFSVVVDDMKMKITHVIRGDDHINNTPRQINILQALSAPIPTYAHVPMILDEQGKKLSKRHGAVSVLWYREQGILPEALLNYLIRLGWSHGDQEIFSLEEMIQYFDLAHIHKSPASLNPDKLLWLNHHYIKSASKNRIANILQEKFEQEQIAITTDTSLTEIVAIQMERCKTINEMFEQSRYFYQTQIEYDQTAVDQFIKTTPEAVIDYLINAFEKITIWDTEQIHQIIQETCEKFNMKMGKIAQPLRVAVTGNTRSPSIDITLKLLGKEKTLTRLNYAKEHFLEKH